MRHAAISIAIGLFIVGCGPRATPFSDGNVSGDGDGDVSDDGTTATGDAPSCAELTAVLRDFRVDHPDFEKATSTDDHGIVRPQLGADGKPVYAHGGATPTVAGPSSFDQWYRDVPNVNMRFELPLPIVEGSPGTFTFDDQDFFPLDGKGWPNSEVLGHNFLFTTEIAATFKYRGGERFEFNGDDDVFVFVNDRLALDLGGVHVAQSAFIDFDAQAAELGIVIGGVYSLAVFHAERHTDQSHFRMVTSIDCFILE
jgi:fibro-slime domain-containing protein